MSLKFKVIQFFTLFAFCISSLGVKGEEQKQKPNILLFLADDMTWRDCQPYGNDEVITPHIAQLAEEGMCFDNMFTATAMSSPTRQQLYTGLFPVRSGAYPNHSRVYEGVKSLGHHFGNLGYRVALVGKRHYAPPESYPIEFLGGRHHDDGDGTDIHIDKIQPILNQDDKPFFMIVSQNQPHAPWNRGPLDLYEDRNLTVPEYMVDCEETRENLKRYYAEITYADSLLGKSLEYLERSGKKDNTIVIFTSEQGSQFPFGKWTCYDLGLKTGFIVRWPGKVDPGTRNDAMTQYVDLVPTLLEAVGGSPGHVNTGITDSEGHTGFDGRSFLDVLLGRKQEHRDYVYGIQTTRGIYSGSVCYPIRSVRSGNYKYILNLNSSTPFYNMVNTSDRGIYQAWLETTNEGSAKRRLVKRYTNRPKEELYNLKEDPYELHNLANDPNYTEIKKELREKLNQWMEQQGDRGIDTELKAVKRQTLWNERGWRSYEEQRNHQILEENQ